MIKRRNPFGMFNEPTSRRVLKTMRILKRQLWKMEDSVRLRWRNELNDKLYNSYWADLCVSEAAQFKGS